MSKELEALENMRADIIDFRDLIEGSSYSTDKDYKCIENALKVLDIILTKSVYDRVNCNTLNYMESLQRYNYGLFEDYKLTEEEFELIKEYYERYNREKGK